MCVISCLDRVFVYVRAVAIFEVHVPFLIGTRTLVAPHPQRPHAKAATIPSEQACVCSHFGRQSHICPASRSRASAAPRWATMVKYNDDKRMSFDGKELSPLAKRVPMVKEKGNKAFDNKNKLNRKSMVKIIDAMCKRSKVVMPLVAYMESEDLEAEVPDTVDSEAWKGGYKQIDRIPKGWVSSWLLMTS